MFGSAAWHTPRLRWERARKAAWARYERDAAQGHKRALAMFRKAHGYELNLQAPKSHSERIWARKLFDHDPRYPIITDKFKARAFIDDVLGAGASDRLCVPILAHVSEIADLPAHIWSQDIILKCTHGSAMNCVVLAGNKKAKAKALRRLKRWMGEVHVRKEFEWSYIDLEPNIIVEPLLSMPKVSDLKLYCYDGMVRFLMTEDNSEAKPVIDLRSAEGTRLPVQFDTLETRELGLPSKLQDMFEIATLLAQGFDMLRVDFLLGTDRFYLGELTLYDGGGKPKFNPTEQDYVLAEFWKQTHLGFDIGDCS